MTNQVAKDKLEQPLSLTDYHATPNFIYDLELDRCSDAVLHALLRISGRRRCCQVPLRIIAKQAKYTERRIQQVLKYLSTPRKEWLNQPLVYIKQMKRQDNGQAANFYSMEHFDKMSHKFLEKKRSKKSIYIHDIEPPADQKTPEKKQIQKIYAHEMNDPPPPRNERQGYKKNIYISKEEERKKKKKKKEEVNMGLVVADGSAEMLACFFEENIYKARERNLLPTKNIKASYNDFDELLTMFPENYLKGLIIFIICSKFWLERTANTSNLIKHIKSENEWSLINQYKKYLHGLNSKGKNRHKKITRIKEVEKAIRYRLERLINGGDIEYKNNKVEINEAFAKIKWRGNEVFIKLTDEEDLEFDMLIDDLLERIVGRNQESLLAVTNYD